jgi:hypothetical protein
VRGLSFFYKLFILRQGKKLTQHTEIRPFGPPILKFSLPQEFLDDLNDCLGLILKKDMATTLDYSDNLAGKVREEIKIPKELLKMQSEFLFGAVGAYIDSLQERASSAHVDHLQNNKYYDKDTEYFEYSILSGWFVRSYAGDYNPAHIHTNRCQLSSVGYLELPDWSDEIEEDTKDHYGLTHGCIQFSFGNPGQFIRNNYTVKPKVGDFYLFPASLTHAVYPFRSEGERRSFSVNFNIQKKYKNLAAPMASFK